LNYTYPPQYTVQIERLEKDESESSANENCYSKNTNITNDFEVGITISQIKQIIEHMMENTLILLKLLFGSE
jgi:hypothetical protein